MRRAGRVWGRLSDAVRRMTIRRKLLLVFVALVFMSNAFIAGTTLSLYINSTRRNIQQHYTNSLLFVAEQTVGYFSELRLSAYILANNTTVQNAFLPSSDNAYERYQKEKYIKGFLRSIDFAKPGVQTFLVTETDGKVYENFGAEYNRAYDFREEKWYKVMSGEGVAEYVVTDNAQSYLMPPARYPGICLVFKVLTSGGRDLPGGYVVHDINSARVAALFDNGYIYPEQIAVVDGEGNVLYNNHDDRAIGETLIAGIPEESKNGSVEMQVNGLDYIVVYNRAEDLGWTFLYASSYDALLPEIPRFLRLMAFYFTVAAFMAIIFAVRLSRLITRPVEILNDGVEQMKKRNFSFKLPENSFDEVGMLTRNFNIMVDRMDLLVNRSREAELLRRQAERESLQQQVNPHFLYNALEMIMGLSSDNNARMVSVVCQSLGGMFRYNLSGREIVTVADEVKHIRNYATIIETRFAGRFRFFFNVDDGVLPLGILKFIIQPFVENAVTHGFADVAEGGVITLAIGQEGGRLRIAVEDNGVGISDEALNELRTRINEIGETSPVHPPMGHIGLLNVYMRLHLRFGSDFSMTITRLNPGTAITMLLPPCLMNEEEK